MNKNKNNTDLEEVLEINKTIAYHKQTFTSTLYRFWLDEGVVEPSYYREMIQVLLTAQEDDVIELIISNGGGQLDSAVNIITAIRSCAGHVHGVIMSECHSAASMIALACHSVHVTPLASMMIHQASTWYGGKFGDMATYVKHMEKRLDMLLDDFYEGFLSAEEITEVKNGGDVWLLASEIEERLEKREEYMEAKMEELQRQLEEEEEQVVAPPKKKRSRKKKED